MNEFVYDDEFAKGFGHGEEEGVAFRGGFSVKLLGKGVRPRRSWGCVFLMHQVRKRARRVTCPPDRVPTRGPITCPPDRVPHPTAPAPTRPARPIVTNLDRQNSSGHWLPDGLHLFHTPGGSVVLLPLDKEVVCMLYITYGYIKYGYNCV